ELGARRVGCVCGRSGRITLGVDRSGSRARDRGAEVAMDRRLIWLICATLASGCVIKSSDGSDEATGGSGGTAGSGGVGGNGGAGGTIPGQGEAAADTLHGAQSSYFGATRQVQASWLAAVDAASAGYTINLMTQPASES